MQLRRSFRLVCAPECIPFVEELLSAEGYIFSAEEFSPYCRRLEHEPKPLGASLAAFFGYIYIQNRSSMLPPLALAPPAGEYVLDMCASPGGKSGFLAQLTGPSGFVLANEPSRARLATLRGNLYAANLLHVATSAYSGEAIPLPPGSCGYILLDAPCSGWGTVLKHPEVLKFWKENKVGRLIALQRRLLARAADLLAPGGVLVYSTCTTNERENEEQLCFAEEKFGLERETLKRFPGFVFGERPNGAGTLRVDGDKSEAQGFFIARLRKPSGHTASDAGRTAAVPVLAANGVQKLMPSVSRGQELAPCVLAGPSCVPGRLPAGRFFLYGDNVRFIPEKSSALPFGLKWQGMSLGRVKGGHFRPAPRIRAFLPEQPEKGKGLVLEDIEEVKNLLSGQSRQFDFTTGRECGLWWRNLPLCLVRLKQGRISAAF